MAYPTPGGWVSWDDNTVDLADWDGDGNVDLLLTANSGLSLARGDGHGDGIFGSFERLADSGCIHYRPVAAADLTGDGRVDAVCLDVGGSFQVVANLAAGPVTTGGVRGATPLRTEESSVGTGSG